MGLETPTYVTDLVQSNPAAGDQVSQGDDHIRNLKVAIQGSFPNANRAFYIPTSPAEQTAGVTVGATDQGKVYPVSASAAARTIALPASPVDGFEVTVLKTDSSTNAVILDPSGATLINGAATWSLTKQWQAVKAVWMSTYSAWLAFPVISSIPYFSGGQDIAFTDIAPSTTAKRLLGATTATDWSETSIATALEWLSTSLARGDLIMRGASAFDRLAPGTSGYFLQSAGAAADLVYADIPKPAFATSTYVTNANLATAIPLDDTIPQITEGDEVLSASITPVRSTSYIDVLVTIYGEVAGGNKTMTAALFKDGAADCVRATSTLGADNTDNRMLTLSYTFLPASVSAIAFTVRVGGSGTVRLNGSSTARYFGGKAAATITVREIFV